MLPEIQNIDTKDNIISRFQGLNQKDTANDEMFKDMLNMTSDEYPYLSPRENGAIRQVFTGNLSMIYGSCVYGEDFYTVQGQKVSGVDTVKFYKNFEEVNTVTLSQQLRIRDLVIYGAYIVIFPDNIMYNTQDGTVTNMSYEHTFTSEDGRIYLSDKDGVPFICDNVTTFNIGGTTTVNGGFNGIISANLDSHTIREMDLYIHNAIDSSYLKNGYCKFIGKRNQAYNTGEPQNLYQANILMGQKEKARNRYINSTTYPIYCIEKSGNEYYIKKYLDQTSAWYPVDLYCSFRITTTEYETIKDKVKIGDYIKLHPLKSNDKDYEESDFNNREATWNLEQKIQNGLKVENIITGEGSVIIVFSNNSIDFLKVLSENWGRYSFGQYLVNPGEEQYNEREIVFMNNAMYIPDAGGTNSLGYKLRLEKNVPQMDYITVSANRIWGCSSANHEIYACKQGDATCWYNYGGLASDSYAVTIPNGDVFTGAVTYNDMPFFFTENMCYSIMGNKPKNYQVQNYALRGVENGASHTLAQKDGYVYYKSKSGIERFNGNNSQSLTEYLDMEGFKGFVGATNNDKYFVFLGADTTHTNLYVYDIKKRQWHKDRDYMPNYMAEIDNNLYLLNGTVGKVYLEKINGHAKEVAPILTNSQITVTYDTPKWYVESGEFNGDSLLNKYVTKFMFELKLEQNSKLSISFMYDDSGEWEEVFRTTDRHVKRLVKVPIKVRRCERMRYKIEGQGQAKIYTVTITFEGGSEIG